MKSSVHTSLLGRWVKGRHVYQNPDYVSPEGSFLEYSRKQKKELTEYQMSYLVYRRVEGVIAAVTVEGESEYQRLKFWILLDGKPCGLEDDAVVMPEGWAPEPMR